MISSINNSQIKNLIQLQKKAKARKEQGLFIAEGIKMFEEAKDNGLVKAYVSESFFNSPKVREKDYFADVEYEIVEDMIFRSISDTVTPQGIIAVVSLPRYDLEKIISNIDANLLILEDIRDPGNLGTIVRTAEGAGITGIIISRESVDIYNPKVIRSTMGSIYRMPFVYVEDILDTVEKIKKKGIIVYAAHLNGKNDYDKENYKCRCGMMIGNEANGLSDRIVSKADCLVKIPMAGKVESLNAGVAAAIMMYEMARQRKMI